MKVPNLPDASKIWAGPFTTCILSVADKLICWGSNQFGNLTTPVSSILQPTVMPGIAGVQDVAMTGMSTCAILADDSVRCWGAADNGLLGDGEQHLAPVSSADAVEPTGMTNVRDIASACRTSARSATGCS